MTAPGYEHLEDLSPDHWLRIERARRLADGREVVLQSPRHLPARPADAAWLEREMALLRRLEVPGLARAGELVRSGSGCWLALDEVAGTPLSRLVARGKADLELFFAVALRLVGLLAELHRREVVLRCIHPGGILVDLPSGWVTLADLSLAARGTAESDAALPHDILLRALPYVSPEQTGRTNRIPDYRSDFYSLGVTLYELLRGEPPFHSDDFLEVIHGHIAKTPPAPAEVDPCVPQTLSRIVMKLLSKTPEERYQSAAGLGADLELARDEWRRDGAISAFPLGRSDVSERFLVPQRLYGRSSELALLLEAFEAATDGPSSLLLVAGYAGIGKTSLIQELYQPIVRQSGAFVSGKCDQVVRNIPYGVLIQALRGLVARFLTEKEDRLAAWRDALTASLGVNAAVLAEVLPEIEMIIGKQPPPPRLGPTETRNRFQRVFETFVGTVARSDHPLVVFLDDLQWVDAATLGLLEPLLTSPQIRCLLLIGAYRSNEVDGAHLLLRTVHELEAAGARSGTILLEPLGAADLIELTADALHDEPQAVEPLAQLVLGKTAGNPFFVGQFLKTLHDDGLVQFDAVRRRWSYQIDRIRRAPLSENVVDLMARKIQRLPDPTQYALTMAACIGTPFDVGVLATASGLAVAEVAERLLPAAAEGLIVPLHSGFEPMGGTSHDEPDAAMSYAFLHDRVQQAAYARLAESDRKRTHLAVGRLLRARWGAAAAEEPHFDLVHHLNLGSELMTDPAERRALARLNLVAGRRAKTSTAYSEAQRYLRAACALLDDTLWERDHALMVEIHMEAAEAEYLCGAFDVAEQLIDLLLARARDRADLARAHRLRVRQYENRSHYAQAVQATRTGLKLLGLELPETEEDKETRLGEEVREIERLLDGRPIEALVNLPLMRDRATRALMELMTQAWAPAYISGDAALTRILSAIMVRLSLVHGNTAESAYGYVTHAITVGPIRGDYAAAYAWGRLALDVNERLDDRRLRAKIHQQFNAHVTLWKRPLETCIPHAREACRSGLETGDFLYAGYGAMTESWPALLTCRSLHRFIEEITPSLTLLERLRMGGLVDLQRVVLNFAEAMRGGTREPRSLSREGFDEEAFVRAHAGRGFFLTILHTLKLRLCVLFDDPAGALEQLASARRFASALEGTIWPVVLDYLEGLALADAAHEGAVAASETVLRLEALEQGMSCLAAACPENFRGWALMLRAEHSRLRGLDAEALQAYDDVVRQAREGDSLPGEAVAHERRARLLLALGRHGAAAAHLQEARALFARWGAAAKVRQLEQRYPQLLRGGAGEAHAPWRDPQASADSATALDIASVAKAAHVLAGEIVLAELLRKLMRIVLENAGAQRGLFLRERDGQLLVEADASVEREEVRVLQSSRMDENADLAASVVRYVRKTGECVVLADAQGDARFGGDAYVVRARPRSVLCVPVVNQGRQGGILYLENSLVAGAFTAERTRVMQILTSEVAVSLENARLYEEMREEVAARRKAEEGLRAALAEVEALKNRLQAENVYLQEEIRTQHDFEEIVGSSPALLEVLARVERVAPTDATVLITGETGTGKEQIARAIHDRSARAGRPLVKLNCGAIAAGLVDSEMFGHVRGAFTGALERRTGRFELADGGTLFLDEVGELSAETQVRLLRVLQEQEFEPVGSSRTVRVDVRVLAATNRDLEAAVRVGTFRSDLYYRLNVFPLRLPPLRERMSDVPALVMFFLAKSAAKLGRKVEQVSAETMARFQSYSWPGNIRELQNVVERAMVLCRGSVLEVGHDAIFMEVPAAPAAPREPRAAAPDEGRPAPSGLETLEEMERRHILAALRTSAGVVEGDKGAARILSLHPNTLRSRMKKLGIRRPSAGEW